MQSGSGFLAYLYTQLFARTSLNIFILFIHAHGVQKSRDVSLQVRAWIYKVVQKVSNQLSLITASNTDFQNFGPPCVCYSFLSIINGTEEETHTTETKYV